MLILGHTGITLGVAVLLSGTLYRGHSLPNVTNEETQQSNQPNDVSSGQETTTGRFSWLAILADRIDIRILLIGSLLPDIIDKPVGMLFFRETLSSGRIFSHTLFFLILITIAGLFVFYRQRKSYLLVLSFGTFTHLILDEMWRTPQTLLWPFYGITFNRVDIEEWLPSIIEALITSPATYLPELVGAAILVWFAVTLVYRRDILRFLKSGRLRQC